MSATNRLLILGKLPPPYFGPAIATRILVNSKLKEKFDLVHFDTTLNSSIEGMGSFSMRKIIRILTQYLEFLRLLTRGKIHLALVPISQETSGFIKDSIFILLLFLKGSKVIIQLRGGNLNNWLNRSSYLMNSYFKFVMRRSAGAIVLGKKLRHLFEDFFPDEQIFVIPNGADFSFPPNAKHEGFHALYIANYLPSKGILALVSSFRFVESGIELVAHGRWVNDVLKKECESMKRQYNLKIELNDVITGEKKLEALSSADCFVFTPNSPEGHPWVIVEALAAGLPIISTDMGAISESVIDGFNGFIVPPDAPEEIAKKINLLYSNNKLRQSMSDNSRKLYLENFTAEKMVNKYIDVFHKISGF